MKKTLIIALVSIGIILIGVYGVRSVKTYLMLRNVAKSVENPVSLRGWMTVPYLSKTYNIPTDYLYKVIGAPPTASNDNHSLHYLRKTYFKDEAEVMLISLQRAISDYKAGEPTNGL